MQNLLDYGYSADYDVIAMIKRRDRDITVTRIPVLIPSRKGKPDGWIPGQKQISPEDYIDEGVTVLALDAIDVLHNPAKVQQLQREFSTRLSDDTLLNLTTLVQLTHAYQTRNIREVARYLKFRTVQLSRKWKPAWEQSPPELLNEEKRFWNEYASKEAKNELQHLPNRIGLAVNENLAKVKFVSWWVIRDKHFSPGLFCRDLETALYALVAAGLGSKKTFAICQLSDCGKQFYQTKRTQRFCSLQCANTARKRREREKKARIQHAHKTW